MSRLSALRNLASTAFRLFEREAGFFPLGELRIPVRLVAVGVILSEGIPVLIISSSFSSAKDISFPPGGHFSQCLPRRWVTGSSNAIPFQPLKDLFIARCCCSNFHAAVLSQMASSPSNEVWFNLDGHHPHGVHLRVPCGHNLSHTFCKVLHKVWKPSSSNSPHSWDCFH